MDQALSGKGGSGPKSENSYNDRSQATANTYAEGSKSHCQKQECSQRYCSCSSAIHNQ